MAGDIAQFLVPVKFVKAATAPPRRPVLNEAGQVGRQRHQESPGQDRQLRDPRFATGFLALAASDTVVFACTLQRGNLKSKIKADLEPISTQGTPVQRIFLFAADLVPTADRHEVQAFVRDTYQVKLEIIDGRAAD